MKTMLRLQQQIETARDLGGIVRTMKTLAAVNIRRYERAVASSNDYVRTVELGFRALLVHHPALLNQATTATSSRRGVLVLGSDQGLCGAFNERVAELATGALGPGFDGPILALGHRVSRILEEGDLTPGEELRVPTSLAGVTPTVADVLERFDRWRDVRGVDRVDLFHNELDDVGRVRARAVTLLPLDRAWLDEHVTPGWGGRGLPSFREDAAALLSRLVQEYLFVKLFQACILSLAAENQSRLSAMQAASQNIDRRLDDLNTRYRTERQRLITEELMDLRRGQTS